MKLLSLLSLLLTLFFLGEGASDTPLQLTHPFDPLTKEEITLIQTIVLKKYPTSNHTVNFHYLDDPEKTTVLKWLSTGAEMPRNAFVIAIIDTETHTQRWASFVCLFLPGVSPLS